MKRSLRTYSSDVVLEQPEAAEVVAIRNAISSGVALLTRAIVNAAVASESAVHLESIFDTAQDGLAESSVVELEVGFEAEVGKHKHSSTLRFGSWSLGSIVTRHTSCF